mmetsp:Transcript_22693/g.37509  ORF Transcript_22693/g.37509 Transcript_22693/m.37509 type:complete len:368 (+) Transcript_22693:239-1342(+)
MEKWANGSLGGRVKLLMICMEVGADGLETTKWFGNQFKLPSTIVNGYIDKESEVPRFGQLGCGGFIILSADGEFVSRRSSPSYLKKGQGGFREVERILSTLGVEALDSPSDGEAASPKRQKGSHEKLHLAPVGNAQMDEEHAELLAAGADLAKQRSVASLRRLRDIWAEHSAHEEALFEQRNFGGARSGGLSGTASHREHHRAILQSLDELLQSCDPSSVVAEEAVHEMLAELQRHGDVYDSGYADKLEDSAVEKLVKGTGEYGTKWMWSDAQGEFEVAFNKDGSFYSQDYLRDAHWKCEFDFKKGRDHIVIDWADLGVFEMKVDLAGRAMSGAYTTSHPNDSTRSWKAKYIGELDETGKHEAACST